MVGTYAWGSNLRWDQGGEGSSEDGRHAYVMNARLVGVYRLLRAGVRVSECRHTLSTTIECGPYSQLPRCSWSLIGKEKRKQYGTALGTCTRVRAGCAKKRGNMKSELREK